LLRLDIGKEFSALEVISRSHSHGIESVLAHLLDEVYIRSLAIGFAALCYLLDALVDVLADLALQVAVVVLEVGAVELFGEPSGLGVGNLGR
jgi:hypothetical protein